MTNAILNERVLAGRGRHLQRLLRPISKYPKIGPKWVRRTIRRDIILGAQDELIGEDNHRNWFFYTFSEEIIGQYYEIWKPLRSANWFLYRAYLNLFQPNEANGKLEGFICLHCDPAEQGADEQLKYKVGPHLHILQAKDPIPKSHIALNACHLEDILGSAELLFEAIEQAILMLRHEILLRY